MYPVTHAAALKMASTVYTKKVRHPLDVRKPLDKCTGLQHVRPNTYTPAEMPGREVLETALRWTPTPLPIPNLGYACLNMDLREQKPPIFTNRSFTPCSHRPHKPHCYSEIGTGTFVCPCCLFFFWAARLPACLLLPLLVCCYRHCLQQH